MCAELSDDALIQRAISGDADALTELLERHAQQTREQIAASMGRVWQGTLDADDVMQVTYMEVFLRIKQFKPTGQGSFPAWFHRVADNNLRDAIRALKRAKRPDPRRRAEVLSNEDSCVALLEMMGVSSMTPSREAARTEASKMLEIAMKTLPADYQQVIRLCDMNGESPADVAKAMQRSTGAIHMLRARAHERLREALGTESQFFTRVG